MRHISVPMFNFWLDKVWKHRKHYTCTTLSHEILCWHKYDDVPANSYLISSNDTLKHGPKNTWDEVIYIVYSIRIAYIPFISTEYGLHEQVIDMQYDTFR